MFKCVFAYNDVRFLIDAADKYAAICHRKLRCQLPANGQVPLLYIKPDYPRSAHSGHFNGLSPCTAPKVNNCLALYTIEKILAEKLLQFCGWCSGLGAIRRVPGACFLSQYPQYPVTDLATDNPHKRPPFANTR